MEKDFIFEEWN